MAHIPFTYENEEAFQIPIVGDQTCFVVSGYATFYADSAPHDGHPIGCTLTGGGDGSSDPRWFGNPVELTVGPKWISVAHVAPVIGIAGISFRDSDTTDDTGYMILDTSWDTVDIDEGGPIHHKRIRIKTNISMCGGEQSAVVKLSYHLTAIGRELMIKHPIHI